jgi:hypothetical protein
MESTCTCMPSPLTLTGTCSERFKVVLCPHDSRAADGATRRDSKREVTVSGMPSGRRTERVSSVSCERLAARDSPSLAAPLFALARLLIKASHAARRRGLRTLYCTRKAIRAHATCPAPTPLVVPCTYGKCHGALAACVGAEASSPSRLEIRRRGRAPRVESSFASTTSRCFIGHLRMPRGSTWRSA